MNLRLKLKYWLHPTPKLKPIKYKPYKSNITKWINNIMKHGRLYIEIYVFFKVLEITLLIWLVFG